MACGGTNRLRWLISMSSNIFSLIALERPSWSSMPLKSSSIARDAGMLISISAIWITTRL